MKRFSIFSIRASKQYIFCVCVIVLLSAICYTLSDVVSYRVVAFILLLGVSLLAVIFDILPVLVSAAISALIWDYFFIPPRFALHVDNTEDAILLGMYFIIAMINGVLTYRIRLLEKAFRLREEKANSVKLYNTILNSLSHELRTPIAAIIGATDNLQLNEHLSPENRNQLIAEVSKASLRLNQQVENLLNISRLESGHIQPKKDWCDVVELVYDVTKRVEENIPGRKINISVNQDMPLCYLDKGMLDQVLYNLASNAVIHTPANAAVYVTAACHADLLEIIVEDSGSSIHQKHFIDLFNKFSREKTPGSTGHGLGLSIVKGFAEAMGGTVGLAKGSYGGARFSVFIPLNHTNIR
jgi:two-component system, OmpR family, sensor histidine kinase KdpD